ncbi:MAG: hypothetical protein MK135_04370, partial [Polyangiaceae bacterium]|nr:hypothetical protein [Polyangiaceae bacterium]
MNKLFKLLVLSSLPTAACGGVSAEKDPADATPQDTPPEGESSEETISCVHTERTPFNAWTYSDEGQYLGAVGAGGIGGLEGLDECPSEQWSCQRWYCDSWEVYCSWVAVGYCQCDPTRPIKPEQCNPDEVFICQAVKTSFASSGRVSCSCISISASPRDYCNPS